MNRIEVSEIVLSHMVVSRGSMHCSRETQDMDGERNINILDASQAVVRCDNTGCVPTN